MAPNKNPCIFCGKDIEDIEKRICEKCLLTKPQKKPLSNLDIKQKLEKYFVKLNKSKQDLIKQIEYKNDSLNRLVENISLTIHNENLVNPEIFIQKIQEQINFINMLKEKYSLNEYNCNLVNNEITELVSLKDYLSNDFIKLPEEILPEEIKILEKTLLEFENKMVSSRNKAISFLNNLKFGEEASKNV